jgi:hypothetical protein
MTTPDIQTTDIISIERDSKGRFLPGTIPPNMIQNPTQASALARKRWDAYQTAAAKRIQAEVGSTDPTIQTPEDAWGHLQAQEASRIMASEHPQPDALRQVGQAMGALPTLADRAADTPTTGARLDISTDALIALATALKQQHDAEAE